MMELHCLDCEDFLYVPEEVVEISDSSLACLSTHRYVEFMRVEYLRSNNLQTYTSIPIHSKDFLVNLVSDFLKAIAVHIFFI